jgi:short-subunit dehydrogenase
MKNLSGKKVLLTGASGGLGVYIAKALAEQGMDLALVAFPGIGLEDLKEEVIKIGRRAVACPFDLRNISEIPGLLAKLQEEMGPFDVLVNNAGVEYTSTYHELPETTLKDILTVNLEVPMVLTRLLLPGMLKRGCGHVVNMSSLAGKSGPGYQEPYAATKAGLIGFTSSLRGTYHGSGFSASVVCPGFVEAGIYTRLKEKTGLAAPALLGTSRPEVVARAVVRCLKKDLPEAIINALPVRPLFALTALAPTLGSWLTRSIGTHDFFRRIHEAQQKAGSNAVESRSSQQVSPDPLTIS